MTTSDEDRIAYLEGEVVHSLTAHERAELDEVRKLLRAPGIWTDPDPRLENRVVEAIVEEARTRPVRPAGGAVRRPRFRPRLTLRRPAYGIAAFAAAAAAAVIIAVALSRSSPAPQQFAMVVSGTSLAPAAHGTATLTKTSSGWQIDLTATGLPHLANGRYYEAWLKNATGLLVPVGTFNDAQHVTLWSGVPVTQFRTLTVTEQQANGNPASSGKRVLGGTIRGSS